MQNVKIEIIDGCKYYTAERSEKSAYTVWMWDGLTYVSFNRSAYVVEGHREKKLAKFAKELIAYMMQDIAKCEALKKNDITPEQKRGQELKITNPRYAIFVKHFGSNRKNWEYMGFINRMKVMYCGDLYKPINDHAWFTVFIEQNAHKAKIATFRNEYKPFKGGL